MGIDVPIYPQFRDMNGMFVEMMDGIGKMQGTFYVMEKPTLRYRLIPEVSALKEQAKVVAEIMGSSVQAGICVTGPYTLSSLFAERSPDIFDLLGDVIKEIVESNVFREKNLEIKLFTLDEPVFGLIDDARIDFGNEGRGRLMKVWESIFSCAKLKGADTSIHLHSTSNSLFLEVGSLDVIGCNVGDPLYWSGG